MIASQKTPVAACVSHEIRLMQFALGSSAILTDAATGGARYSFGIDPFLHHYLALVEIRDSEEKVLRSLHGLATRAQAPDLARIVPVGGRRDNLYVYELPGQGLRGRHVCCKTLMGSVRSGDEGKSEAESRFDRLSGDARGELNRLNLRYRLLLQNSNSMARWMCEALLRRSGIAERHLDIAALAGPSFRRPGWKNTLSGKLYLRASDGTPGISAV